MAQSPQGLVALVPTHLSGVGFTVFVLALRFRLRSLQTAEQSSREAEELRILSIAEADRRRRLSLLVHDRVLSVLNAAMLAPQPVPEQLRAEAATALELLSSSSTEDDDGAELVEAAQVWETAAALRSKLMDAWLRLDPFCRGLLTAEGGARYRPTVTGAVFEASLESMRNSLRHAGSASKRTITAHLAVHSIDLEACDDGNGFDVAAVPIERMGIRNSVLARMQEVGGTASITTSPGSGTGVRITWPKIG